MRLNLFSSDQILPDYLNVDIWKPPNATSENFQQADLRNFWPWKTSSVDEIRAHDGPEHLDHKIQFMNEAHRCLKPGGLLDIFVPTTDGRGAWQDPQHVSFWNVNSFFYYVDCFAEWIRFHEAYGITARFRVPGSNGNPNEAERILEAAHREYKMKVWKLKITLEACK